VSDFPDPDRFTVFAIGDVDVNGITIEVTFLQQVTTNNSNEFSVSVEIKSVGTFQLHVKEGTTGLQNSFLNSPIEVTITAAATAAKSTIFEKVEDAEFRIFTLTTFDEYNNPTNNIDDIISYNSDVDETVSIADSKEISVER